MKTISFRQLHNKPIKGVLSAKDEEKIMVTDPGETLASLRPAQAEPKMAADSSASISEDGTSQENSVAGTEG